MLMKKLRESTRVFIIIIIVAFVGTIFFTWGMDISRSSKNSNVVGSINSKKISYSHFKRVFDMNYNQLLQQQRDNGGENDGTVLKTAKEQTWEQFITENIHKDIFNRYGLSATEEQLYQYFVKTPPPQLYSVKYFQKETGGFDTTKYIEFLNSPQAFTNEGMIALEENARTFTIPLHTFQDVVGASVINDNLSAKREALESIQKGKFEYVKISLDKIKIDSNAIDEKSINEYYNTNPDSFRTEALAELEYVRIEKKASAADENRARLDLVNIKKSILKGEQTFEEAAKDESDDISAKDGGTLGWFSKGAMVKGFEDVAFALKKGEISDPVRTSFGWHLIKLVDKRRGEVKASHILIKVIPSLETLDSLRDIADSIVVMTDVVKNLSDAAKKIGLNVSSTGLFAKDELPSGMDYISGLFSFAFSKNNQKISEVLENDKSYYVLQLKRRIPKGILPIKDCRNRIIVTLTENKKAKIASNKLLAIREQLKGEKTLKQLAKADNVVEFGITDTITRGSFVEGVGISNPVIYKAFSLNVGDLSTPIKEGRAVFMVRNLFVSTPSSQELAVREAMVFENTLNQKKYRSYYEWYNNEKEKSEIDEHIDDFISY